MSEEKIKTANDALKESLFRHKSSMVEAYCKLMCKQIGPEEYIKDWVLCQHFDNSEMKYRYWFEKKTKVRGEK